MKINFMPETHLGKWSVGLIIAFFLLFISFMLLVASGQQGGETFFSNPILSIPALLAGICAIAAFFTGVISIVKKKERSVLVYISTLISFFVLWFILGEIFVSH